MPPDGVGSGGHRSQASCCGWSSCWPARCSTPPPDDPMLTGLLQTAAALTVLNVAPLPVRHPDSAGAATARGFETGWMIQPDQARRFLTLQHRSHLTESLECMIAKSFASPCSLQRIGPASVAPIPAPPVEGADFGPAPARPHGAPAAPSCFRYVVEHQPTARVRTFAEPAGIIAREQLRC